MPEREESYWKSGYLSDQEIYALIRYLDPNPESGKQQKHASHVTEQSDAFGFAICIGLLILVLGTCALMWFCSR